jgi:hypothetical protein
VSPLKAAVHMGGVNRARAAVSVLDPAGAQWGQRVSLVNTVIYVIFEVCIAVKVHIVVL